MLQPGVSWRLRLRQSVLRGEFDNNGAERHQHRCDCLLALLAHQAALVDGRDSHPGQSEDGHFDPALRIRAHRLLQVQHQYERSRLRLSFDHLLVHAVDHLVSDMLLLHEEGRPLR